MFGTTKLFCQTCLLIHLYHCFFSELYFECMFARDIYFKYNINKVNTVDKQDKQKHFCLMSSECHLIYYTAYIEYKLSWKIKHNPFPDY